MGAGELAGARLCPSFVLRPSLDLGFPIIRGVSMGLIFQQNEFRFLYDLRGWLTLLRPTCLPLRKGGLPWGEIMGGAGEGGLW